jgi:hypothetical protein
MMDRSLHDLGFQLLFKVTSLIPAGRKCCFSTVKECGQSMVRVGVIDLPTKPVNCRNNVCCLHVLHTADSPETVSLKLIFRQ